jgi:hypothetical protein
MDEYFCTSCGAILNNQYGFDPDVGTWTCTECNQHLMDEDVYEGDVFEGVAWYCDNCGVLLNKQFGFMDSFGTWTCTECYHINGITEDDIIKDSDNNLQCPNCYSVLDDQWLFDKNNYEWTCTSCGAYLHHNYSDDNYSIVEEDDEDDDECESEKIELHNSSRSNSSRKINSDSTTFVDERLKLPDERLRKKRIKAFFLNGKKIPIGYDYNELLRRNIAEVYAALHNKAFNNIKIIPSKDIYASSPYKVGEVEQIMVGGIFYFESINKFKYDTEIVITYHEKREIKVPFSANALHKLNCDEVTLRLQDLGFKSVRKYPIKDLVTGWLIKDGSVERVSIAGNDNFKANTTYPYDAKIVIEFHTFKTRK